MVAGNRLGIGWLLAVALLLAACEGGAPPDGVRGVQGRRGGTGLQAADAASLVAYFRAALRAAPEGPVIEGPVIEGPVIAAEGGPATSATNVQVPGVDEADLLVADGDWLYALDPGDDAGHTLRVLALAEGGRRLQPQPPLSLADPLADHRATGLYLDAPNRRLVVLGGSDGRLWLPGLARRDADAATDVLLFDLARPATPALARRWRFQGRLVASRRVDGRLYLVLHHVPRLAAPSETPLAPQAVAERLANLTAADLLPDYRLDGVAQGELLRPEDCYLPPDQGAPVGELSVVLALDLDAPTQPPLARCYVGPVDTLYASRRALYLARVAATPGGRVTRIHKFGLAGGELAYRGSGEVPGDLGRDPAARPFRLDEGPGGELRVLSVTGAADSPVRLTVLRETPLAGPTTAGAPRVALLPVASLPDEARPTPLGRPGERLYASRYAGDWAFLVTFRTVDPLYVLDLRQPARPRVAGQLKADGYLDYLHPLGDGLLLGVGKAVALDADGNAWAQGVRIALLDVTDPTGPRELEAVTVGGRGSDAAVLADHHGIALQTVGETVRVALPLRRHDGPARGEGPAAYRDHSATGLYRLEVDRAARRLRLLPPLDTDEHMARPLDHDRALLVGDNVHLMHAGRFWSQDWPGATPADGPQ